MSYFDLYKKRLMSNGGTPSAELVNNNNYILEYNFRDDPSYRKAKLIKTDLTTKDIGVRAVNIDSKPNENKLYVLPNEDISVGDYISFTHKDKKYTYLIDSFEDNLISPFAKGVKCRNILKWIDMKGDIQEFPCIVSYQSYGVKIFQSNNDFIQETSTNIDVEIPRNSITENIPLSLRVMFGNSRHGIYKVGDIATYEQGILKLTCKKDKYLKDLDDIENNLPWNGEEGETPTPPSTDYIIKGEDTIKVNNDYAYTVEPQEGNVTFELDEYTVSENIAEIISTDSYSCVVKALKGNELVTLNAIVDGQVVASIDISTVRY